MVESDIVEPVEVSLVVEGVQDGDSVRSILEISDRVREEHGLAVRVEIVSNVALEPLTGWVYTLSHSPDPLSISSVQGENNYIVLRNGPHVRVIITGSYSEESIERALVEAALQALAHNSGLESLESVSERSRSDPGSFASGEYITAFSTA